MQSRTRRAVTGWSRRCASRNTARASLSTSAGGGISFATATRWAVWADAWDAVFVEDLDGDGLNDLLGLVDGQWWAATSDGASFGTATRWAVWADVAWDAVGTFDADHDGETDVYGLLDGTWYVGLSDGSRFATSRPNVSGS